MSIEELKEKIQLMVKELDVEVLTVGWQKQGNDKILQIVIDSPRGVDIDMCADVSNTVEDVVDEFADTEDNFFLEVTSAGAERPYTSYEELQGAIGSWIHVQLKNPKQGDHIFEGELINVDSPEEITITYKEKTRNKKLCIAYDEIAHIRRAVKF